MSRCPWDWRGLAGHALQSPRFLLEMALSAGSSLGAYEIQSPLGAGGMGEVYRARDTKLGRSVAIKVLPEAFTFDANRVARFEREAKVLASLNHPHIAALHGMETAGGRHFLIMELVEGDTLADRVQRGPVPVEQALKMAIQIAGALEAAHEKGVIHRDLKPANVKITPDERVKVLDFGLAKAMDTGAAPPADVTQSPTVSVFGTQAGVILGTAAYMSPEQARGAPADHRSDVFSLGCVLYEMLTGRQPFRGNTVPDLLASVLAREADLTALPPDLNPGLTDLLRRCLDKNPKRRWQAVGDLRVELEAIAAAPHALPTQPAVVTHSETVWRRLALFSAPAIVIGAVLAGGGIWFAMRPIAPQVAHLSVTLPRAAGLAISGVDRDLNISADGSRLVYVGANGTQIFVRPIDSEDATLIFSGASARQPAVSPDGQWVAFADANVLKKVAITGGPALTLAAFDAAPRGLTWISDDTVVFSSSGPTGLQRVSAAGGGSPATLTRPDRARGEVDHFWPEALPGGRAVLFTITAVGGLNAAQIAVLDLQAGTYKVLVRGGSHAHYAPSGHLVYTVSGTLHAIPFDLASLEIRGAPVPVVSDVMTTSVGSVNATIASNGTLAYVSGTAGTVQRTLVWTDRQGKETPIPAPPRTYVYPRLSPDGMRIAVWVNDQDSDIWIWDIGRSTLTRATFDPGLDGHPAWAPDGRRIVVSSERAGARNLYWQAADGTGTIDRLTESVNLQNATSVSPDGARLIFYETRLDTSDDLMQLELSGTRRVMPLVQTPFTERNGMISPDGRWLAYEANDSGQFEIYGRPFPDVESGHWQVSTGGGSRPLWARSGQELFYLSPAGALMRVGVERGPSWASAGSSMLVKAEGYFTVPGANPSRTYDVSVDGQRFLMIKTGTDSDRGSSSPGITVVLNWIEELKQRVPTP